MIGTATVLILPAFLSSAHPTLLQCTLLYLNIKVLKLGTSLNVQLASSPFGRGLRRLQSHSLDMNATSNYSCNSSGALGEAPSPFGAPDEQASRAACFCSLCLSCHMMKQSRVMVPSMPMSQGSCPKSCSGFVTRTRIPAAPKPFPAMAQRNIPVDNPSASPRMQFFMICDVRDLRYDKADT
jgi:hypothetical protein